MLTHIVNGYQMYLTCQRLALKVAAVVSNNSSQGWIKLCGVVVSSPRMSEIDGWYGATKSYAIAAITNFTRIDAVVYRYVRTL